MYNIMIDYKIGVNVKNKITNKIYEITKVTIEITKSDSPKGDQILMVLEGIDIKKKNSFSKILDPASLVYADQDDIEQYLLGTKELKPQKVISDGEIETKNEETEAKENKIANQFEAFNRIYSIDELLDEMNRCKNKIKEEGDEEGIYKNKIKELNKKLAELSS